MTILQLAREYAPYNLLPAFEQGFQDYKYGCCLKPVQVRNIFGEVGVQAYDRGTECSRRWAIEQALK